MKKLVLLLCTILATGSLLLAQSPPALTANYYMLQPEKYLDKNVSLNVAKIVLDDKTATDKNGFKEVRAYTINNGSDGGYISILATPPVLTRIVTLCGTADYEYIAGFRPHVIQGIFTKYGDHYALKVEK